MDLPPMVEVCEAYQGLGWHVFPVNGKLPATKHGFKDASPETRLASVWFSQFPDRGIALATGKVSGVWVLDVDGPEGEDALGALEIEHGELPETVEGLTGKGRHLFFQMPPEGDVRCSVSQIAEKVDVRGTGGYVVLPPSPHPSGSRYQWVPGRKPIKRPVARAPDWLIELVTAPMQLPSGERFSVPDEIPHGQRDQTLFKLGCSLRAKGLSEDAIFAALQVENRDRCNPPMEEEEVRAKAVQAAKYEPGSFPLLGTKKNGKGEEDSQKPPPTPEESFILLRELLERPELLEPPEPVVERFVWRGRTTGLIGPDKSGKSTLAAHMVAALTKGDQWLGHFLEDGSAVVAAPDEAVGDTVRRLHELGADPDRVRILALRPPDLLQSLENLLETNPADLVLIDSLAEWARLILGQAPDDGDAAGWGAVIRPIVAISHMKESGILLLHHPRRSDGQYRGSGEIAAALDCLIEMRMPEAGEDQGTRKFKGRARWPIEDFSIRLDMETDRYEETRGREMSLDARILAFVRMNPGTTITKAREALNGRTSTFRAAINVMAGGGSLVERPDGRARRLYLPDDLPSEMRF